MNTIAIRGRSSLSEVCQKIGPLPNGALFLGVVHEDNYPLLLNMNNEVLGPLLVVGYQGNTFLRNVADALEKQHSPANVEFGVITSSPKRWKANRNGVGFFHPASREAEEFLLSLATWSKVEQKTNQTILLLIDDLDEVMDEMNPEFVQILSYLLRRGTKHHIWPIVTTTSWKPTNQLDSFGIHIFSGLRPVDAEAFGVPYDVVKVLLDDEFVIREDGRWLKFWIPS